ncbi:MAG TPA: hypothetical protein VL550_05105 [Rhodocyclaceae bacterium]|nr:hypothetical protein [Rhodocyclaceae bacterium]
MNTEPHTEFFWAVPLDHPVFPGHFPERPIVPGVLLLDEAIRCTEKWRQIPAAPWQVREAKFLSPVAPGENLSIQLTNTSRGSIEFRIATVASTTAAQRTVASGMLTPAHPAA